jgi:hypothetical protein
MTSAPGMPVWPRYLRVRAAVFAPTRRFALTATGPRL